MGSRRFPVTSDLRSIRQDLMSGEHHDHGSDDYWRGAREKKKKKNPAERNHNDNAQAWMH